jgi:hypothetical protein
MFPPFILKETSLNIVFVGDENTAPYIICLGKPMELAT